MFLCDSNIISVRLSPKLDICIDFSLNILCSEVKLQRNEVPSYWNEGDQLLNVQVEISGEWCPSGVCTRTTTVFLNSDMGRGTRLTLSRLPEDTKLNSAVNMPEGWDAMQRDVEKHKKWACGNIIGFKKAKSKVLHLGQDQPQYPCRPENDGIEGSLSYLGVLVCEKFNMSRQHVLPAQKANLILGCIKQNMAHRLRELILSFFSAHLRLKLEYWIWLWIKQNMAHRFRELILSFFSAHLRLRLEYWIWLWSPHHRKALDLMEWVQRRTMKMIGGMEYHSYDKRLRELELFSQENRRLWGTSL